MLSSGKVRSHSPTIFTLLRQCQNVFQNGSTIYIWKIYLYIYFVLLLSIQNYNILKNHLVVSIYNSLHRVTTTPTNVIGVALLNTGFPYEITGGSYSFKIYRISIICWWSSIFNLQKHFQSHAFDLSFGFHFFGQFPGFSLSGIYFSILDHLLSGEVNNKNWFYFSKPKMCGFFIS